MSHCYAIFWSYTNMVGCGHGAVGAACDTTPTDTIGDVTTSACKAMPCYKMNM